MNDNEIVSKVAQILASADQAYNLKASTEKSPKSLVIDESDQILILSLFKARCGLRKALFGMAIILLSIMTVQVGLVFDGQDIRAVLFGSAAINLLLGVRQFDAGSKILLKK